MKGKTNFLRAKREDDSEETEDLSYYRHITGIYKPYRPEMIRTLRSDSVERQLSPGNYYYLDTININKSRSCNPLNICARLLIQLSRQP